MEQFRFEWDEAKNLANKRKHGVSFQLASEVFDDPLHVTHTDRITSGEKRWQTFGHARGMLLMVAHTISDEDGTLTRIISARRVDRRERRTYEEQHG